MMTRGLAIIIMMMIKGRQCYNVTGKPPLGTYLSTYRGDRSLRISQRPNKALRLLKYKVKVTYHVQYQGIVASRVYNIGPSHLTYS